MKSSLSIYGDLSQNSLVLCFAISDRPDDQSSWFSLASYGIREQVLTCCCIGLAIQRPLALSL